MSVYKTANESAAVNAMVKAATDLLAQAFAIRRNLAIESGAVSNDETLATFVATEMENLEIEEQVEAAMSK